MRLSLLSAAALLAPPAVAQIAPASSPFEAVRGQPAMAGAWTYRSTPAVTESTFAGRFSLRCDRVSRLVTLQRFDAGTPPPWGMVISTDSVTRSFAGSTLSLNARDPLLDAIAFSRGRFVVTGAGVVPLLVPAWPEAARSIEDCRN